MPSFRRPKLIQNDTFLSGGVETPGIPTSEVLTLSGSAITKNAGDADFAPTFTVVDANGVFRTGMKLRSTDRKVVRVNADGTIRVMGGGACTLELDSGAGSGTIAVTVAGATFTGEDPDTGVYRYGSVGGGGGGGSAPTTVAQLAAALSGGPSALKAAIFAQDSAAADTGLASSHLAVNGAGTSLTVSTIGTAPKVMGRGKLRRLRFGGAGALKVALGLDMSQDYLIVWIGTTRVTYLTPGTHLSLATGADDANHDLAISSVSKLDGTLYSGREGMVFPRAGGTIMPSQNGPGDQIATDQVVCFGAHKSGTTTTQYFGRQKRLQVTSGALSGTGDLYIGKGGATTTPEYAITDCLGALVIQTMSANAAADYELALQLARNLCPDVATGSPVWYLFDGDSICNMMNLNYLGDSWFTRVVAQPEMLDCECVNMGAGGTGFSSTASPGIGYTADRIAALTNLSSAKFPTTAAHFIEQGGTNDAAFVAAGNSGVSITGAQLWTLATGHAAAIKNAGFTSYTLQPIIDRGAIFGGSQTAAGFRTVVDAYHALADSNAAGLGIRWGGSTLRSAFPEWYVAGDYANATYYVQTAGTTDQTHPNNTDGQINYARTMRAPIGGAGIVYIARTAGTIAKLSLDLLAQATASSTILEYGFGTLGAGNRVTATSTAKAAGQLDAAGGRPYFEQPSVGAAQPVIDDVNGALVFDGVATALNMVTQASLSPFNALLYASPAGKFGFLRLVAGKYRDTRASKVFQGWCKDTSANSDYDLRTDATPNLDFHCNGGTPADLSSAKAPSATLRGFLLGRASNAASAVTYTKPVGVARIAGTGLQEFNNTDGWFATKGAAYAFSYGQYDDFADVCFIGFANAAQDTVAEAFLTALGAS